MKNIISQRAAQYTPVSYKSFCGALNAFLEQELPQIGGSRTRKMLVNVINDMVCQFFPETSHLRPGQTSWITVNAKSKGCYGKSIQNTELIPVVLDLVQSIDAEDRAEGKHIRDVKKEAVARLCLQAYDQGGCITATELAVLLKASPCTIGKYIKEYEQENQVSLPRRGTIHDMGPTLTHKKMIIEKLFVEQKRVEQVMRETYHSARAIERYITSFKQVLMCQRKGMNLHETSFAVKKTPRLVKEYISIINDYKNKGYILDTILQYEIKMETASQFYEPSYQS